MKTKSRFESEADLCAAFVAALPPNWTAYPESCGFDIVLLRSDGTQIGVEAKLRLNAEVIGQIIEDNYDPCRSGPDYRAVLVPSGTVGALGAVCTMLGITVIEMMDDTAAAERWRWSVDRTSRFHPTLPSKDDRHWTHWWSGDWLEWAPTKRLTLPAYVPDVVAGHSAPVKLTPWKIKAIKIAILLERRGSVTRQDFKAIQIDYRRWIAPYTGWLQRGDTPGRWVAGTDIGSFKAQHPKNYEEIAADFEKWAPKTEVISAAA